MSTLENVGLYRQLKPFTNENAGTSEWCPAEKDGRKYFIKMLQTPVYPSKDIGLPEKKYNARVNRFHHEKERIERLYEGLRLSNTSGALVVPIEVMPFRNHICTVAEFINGNLKPRDVWKLSEWQRIILMRSLTLALMNVHKANIVHSDMKPDNVLIIQKPETGNCILKLIDFDGSFLVDEQPEEVTGDQAYFSPESYIKIEEGDIDLDQRADIFSLGLIFHYFWTGGLPTKPDELSIGQCVLLDESFALDPGLPAKLSEIITETLKPREERISCEKIYEGLGSLASDYPVKIVNLQDSVAVSGQYVLEFVDTAGSELQKSRTIPHTGDISLPEPEPIRGYRYINTETHDTADGKVIRFVYVPTSKSLKRIRVEYDDMSGRAIKEADYYDIPYGSEQTIYAKSIHGWNVSGESEIRIKVDEFGNVTPKWVGFVYDRIKDSPPPTVIRPMISIYCVDTNGHHLRPEMSVELKLGNNEISAPYLDGYTSKNTSETVLYSSGGTISRKNVTFVYERKQSSDGCLKIVLWCFVISCILLVIMMIVQSS